MIPLARACWMMAASCGLASSRATAVASPVARSLVTMPALLLARASQGISASTATMTTRMAISWSVSTAAPSTTPRMTACRQPGRRVSRTAASRAIGMNSSPSARLRWYQDRQTSMEDRPKNAPAAIAPDCERSHSRATR